MLCSEKELCLSEEHDGIISLPTDAKIGSSAALVLGLDDPIIEIEVTPNRGDWSGVYGIARDLAATGIGTLRWLINAPKIKATVVDMRGMPCVITAPDPRCFAVHKMWLSKQEGRNPQKKGKDRAQALIVAELVREYLPMLKFEPEQLRMFPKALLDSFSDELDHM
ncbi:MAG: hypothetical protein COB79_02940 [Zetaproteobacteria bacterium]|nr:MAG: hypothetical protein COB79_02940 [Zetaproteobacteria bacterium]